MEKCDYKNGMLPECAPLALAYTPMQQCSEPAYDGKMALARGTLFPGLDLPFMNMVNKPDKRFADFLGVQYKENASIGDYPLIKCNINRTTKERIYHLPFDQQYDRVVISPNSEECYAWTVQEAEDKGFRRAWRWHSQQGATS